MNNKVQNPKIELESSIEMNDENYLNDITPCDPSSIWRKYQKMNEILSK